MRRMLLVVLLLIVAGCSDNSGAEDAGPTKLEVGVVPVIDVAPLYLGIEKGFFTEQRLDVAPKQLQAGATIVAAVISGDQKIGFSNNTSLLIAASKQAPLRIVAAGNQASAGDYAVIFVPTGSRITSAKDLAGKRIAVNNVNNVGSLSINAGLEASGVDITGVTYVEIPFPQMQAALTQHRVDAAWAVEPFASAIKTGGGVTAILRPYPLIAPHFPVSSYFTSTAYAGSHSDVVSRFRAAMNKSLSYAQSNPAEVRRILPTFIKLTPEVAAQVVLPEWNPDVGAPLLARTAELAQKYGYLTQAPDVSQLVGQ